MAPISGYFDKPFGIDGDLTAVPDAVQPDGSVSYDQGYPIGYSTPIASGGLNIERAKMNQLFFDITSALQQLQQFSVPPFITSAMNGGTAFSYSKNARVILGGVIYQSLANANVDTPPSSNWVVADIGATNIYTAGTTTGTANAQVAGTTSPLATSFTTGQAVICTAGYTNTGPMTIGAGGETPIAVNKNSVGGLVALVGGEVIAGDTLFMVKNTASSCWVLEAGLPIGSLAYKNLANPTQQLFTSGSGTYNTPAGCLRIHVRMVGAGAGAGASGGSPTGGSNGGTTSFGSFSAVGGNGGTTSTAASGGTGGTGGTGSAIRFPGQDGEAVFVNGTQTNPGSGGGSSFFGGGASIKGYQNTPGAAAKANTGGGGSGGTTVGTVATGAGGGAGESAEFTINSPTSTYSYAVGAHGAGGTGTQAGGNGADGIIIVDEYYY